jgi:ketosteroid isomerase-like protein
MTIDIQTQTRQIVRAYFDAWTQGDVAAVGQYLADDLSFSGSVKSLNSAADYLVALGNFRKLVTNGTDLISELYGESEATLVYESQTVAGTIRLAEHIRLSGGKISSILLIFDPTALLAFKARASASQ